MRGVEAGMGMVNIKARKTGKLLKSGRRQRREEQTPYGRGSSSRGVKLKPTGTRTSNSEAPNAQGLDTKAASSFSGDGPPPFPV